MQKSDMVGLLFVCTGNICRSPTAEGVMRAKLLAAGLADRVAVDSAGVEDYHAGAPPDERTQDHARRRGYELGGQRARQLRRSDFEQFDWLLAMDRSHLAVLKRQCPAAQAGKLRLFMAFSAHPSADVPDPYYGREAGFDAVLDLVEAGCDGLLAMLRRNTKGL
jgi:protein-tyrosine phosphatase